jgi:hypothetical protein
MKIGQIIKTSPVGIIIFTHNWKWILQIPSAASWPYLTHVSRNMVALSAAWFLSFVWFTLRPWRWGSMFLRNVGEFYRTTWRYILEYGACIQKNWGHNQHVFWTSFYILCSVTYKTQCFLSGCGFKLIMLYETHGTEKPSLNKLTKQALKLLHILDFLF